MADYSQMIAIPRNEYAQLTAVQNARQPLTQQFYKLESDYQGNRLIPDAYRSIALQSETIEHMKDLKDQMRNYITTTTPKPYRSRAEALFHSLESYLNVNKSGEIIQDDGSAIESSRIEDLIQHAVRDRRRPFSPIGWNYFVSLLKKHNVPRSSLNLETLRELQAPMKPTKMIRASKRPQPSKLRQPSKIPHRYLAKRADSPPTKQRRGRDVERSRTPSKRKKAPPRRFMFEFY